MERETYTLELILDFLRTKFKLFLCMYFAYFDIYATSLKMYQENTMNTTSYFPPSIYGFHMHIDMYDCYIT